MNIIIITGYLSITWVILIAVGMILQVLSVFLKSRCLRRTGNKILNFTGFTKNEY